MSSIENMLVIRVCANRVQWVSVQKDNVVDNLVEVFGDLQPGVAIVRTASEEIRDGQAVTSARK